jgi:hypothetical protein
VTVVDRARRIGQASSLGALGDVGVVALLEQLDLGVTQIRGAEGGAVVFVDETSMADEAQFVDGVFAAAGPLVARRRDVFRLRQGSAEASASTLIATFGENAFALVGGTTAARIACLVRSVSALLVVEPVLPTRPPGSCSVLVVVPTEAAADLAATAWPTARTALADHPAEVAHLIDSHLREPERHAPGARLPRSRP